MMLERKLIENRVHGRCLYRRIINDFTRARVSATYREGCALDAGPKMIRRNTHRVCCRTVLCVSDKTRVIIRRIHRP